MADAAQQLEEAISLAQEAVSKQGDTVRSLKASAKDGKAEKVRLDLRCLQLRRRRGSRAAP